MKKNGFRQSFSSRKFKMGGFQTLTMVIVVVVVVVLNLIVGKMNITKDLSSDKIYSLTEDTVKMAEKMQDTITIYHMVQSGRENIAIEKVLEQYDKLGHISVEKKDPVIYPNFSKSYTDDEIADNDLLVVNEEKDASRHVAFEDMYLEDMDYTTYSQTRTLDAEGQITAAIQSITSAETKKAYAVSGHGEAALEGNFTDILTKSNVTIENLETAKAEKVPEDCDILIINGPQYDITEAEYTLLANWLQNGGKAMLFLNPLGEEQPNYKKLYHDYGIDITAGYVVDSKQCLNVKFPMVIAPDIKNHDMTAEVKEGTVFASFTAGMSSQKEVRSTLTVEPLLQTSDTAFSRTDMEEQSFERIDSDISGPFFVAAAVTDTYAEKKNGIGHATKIAAYGFCYDNQNQNNGFLSSTQFGNRAMLLNSLGWLTGSETDTLAIPTRSLDMQSVRLEDGDRIFWTVLLVVILPLAFLGSGFVIWYRRRKR